MKIIVEYLDPWLHVEITEAIDAQAIGFLWMQAVVREGDPIEDHCDVGESYFWVKLCMARFADRSVPAETAQRWLSLLAALVPGAEVVFHDSRRTFEP